MANVFISYAHEDGPIAKQLSDMLRTGGQRVFFDEQAIVSGVHFTNQTKEALAKADAVVVLLSRNANRSNRVETDLRNALQKDQLVIPVLLDEDATRNWVWPLISDRGGLGLGFGVSPCICAD
jgi:TIR domain